MIRISLVDEESIEEFSLNENQLKKIQDNFKKLNL